MYSKSAQYGIQAMIYMAVHFDKNTNIGLLAIAKDQNIPSHFLSKILQILVKKKLLKSIKGPNGGFQFNKPLDKITLKHIVDVIDGKNKHLKCIAGYKHCSDDKPCPIHSGQKNVNEYMEVILEGTLEEYSDKVLSGPVFIKATRRKK